ncbi:MAG: hypothetical protein ACREQ5_19815 [Candidatus Dormibacteria bacterium]
MGIRIWRRSDRYDVVVTSGPGLSRPRRSAEPLTAVEVVTLLEEAGCTPTEIGDVMSAADPLWMERLAEPQLVMGSRASTGAAARSHP